MKLRKASVVLAVAALLSSLALTNIDYSFSTYTGREIDLFTQKAPFDGRGTNQSSDAFQPQELVILFALVTYNDYPVANKLVSYQVNNQPNPYENITVVGVSPTNTSGMAQFSFRIPWPIDYPEQIVFGEWHVIASVDIAEQTVSDTLTFEVGWMIKITRITTLNAALQPQRNYLREDTIVFNLTVQNIAFTFKSATITIDAWDSISFPIIHLEIDNLTLQPGINNIQASSQIPITAMTGEATVSAVAYTFAPATGGIPYSPAATTTFEVATPQPTLYYLTVRASPNNATGIPGEGWYEQGNDVSLTAPEHASTSQGIRYRFVYWDVDGVSQGIGIYRISVHMDSNHTATANFVVQLSVTFRQTGLDQSAQGTVAAINGAPKTFNDFPYILWVDNNSIVQYSYSNTVSSGIAGKMFHLVNVTGPLSPITVSRETFITGNFSIQYHLSVVSLHGTPKGDGWYDSGSIAYAGLQDIHVSILNQSRTTFTFWSGDASGTNYAQSSPILMNAPKIAVANWKTQCHLTVRTDPRQISSIAGEDWYDQYQNVTLVAPSVEGYEFRYWDVDGVSQNAGARTIVVYISSPRIATAHYSRPGWSWPPSGLFLWLLLLLLILLILLPIIWLFLRKRRKNQQEFLTGWSAWYYGYDMRSKRKGNQGTSKHSSGRK